MAGFILECMAGFVGIRSLPTPDGGTADIRAARDFSHREPFGREQNNLRALNMFSGAIAVTNDGEQTLAIAGYWRQDADGLSHSAGFAHLRRLVNLPSVSVN